MSVDLKNASTPLAARWMQRFRDSQIEGSQTEESETDDESRHAETRASPNPQRTAADKITETFDVEYRPNKAIQDPTGTEGQGTGGSSRQRSGSERDGTRAQTGAPTATRLATRPLCAPDAPDVAHMAMMTRIVTGAISARLRGARTHARHADHHTLTL